MTAPGVSVVVTSTGSAVALRRCLASLVRRAPPAQIVVAEGGAIDPAPWCREEFPGVVVMHCPGAPVPALRWMAAKDTTAEVIAAIESHMEASPDWWQQLAAAHARWPDARVVGGAVAPAPGADAASCGLYLSEYVEYAPRPAGGPARSLSSANLSYKRTPLFEERETIDAGAWETGMHERWSSIPGAVRFEPAPVIFVSELSARQAASMRFAYGRAYAAARVPHRARAARWLRATTAIALPVLLTLRALRAAIRFRSPALTPGGVVWLIAFNVCWSAGELVGYVAGPAQEGRP